MAGRAESPLAHAPPALLAVLTAVMEGAAVAPRQSVSAAAAACTRVAAELLGVSDPDPVLAETRERMARIRPVIASHVAAGASGVRANIPGRTR